MRKIFTIAILALSINAFAQIPTDSLKAWYPFNGNANDASGNGNNGTVNGATLAPDRFGNANSAYSFNGSNNYISVSQIANLTANQTKCFWIKPEALASNMYIIDEGNNNNWTQLYDDDFDGKLELKTGCVTNGVSIVISNQEFTQTGTWFFVAVTLGTDSIIKFYINGLLDNSGELHNVDNPSSIVIGKSGAAGYFFNGIIDDIRIYNRALDSAEINSLFNEGLCYQTITVTDTLIINANLTGFNPVTYQNTIKVYPNPTNDHIIIDYGNYSTLTGYTLKITNSLGQTVFTSAINQQQSYIDLSTWSGNGIYFVHLIDAQSNTIDIRKIVIQ